MIHLKYTKEKPVKKRIKYNIDLLNKLCSENGLKLYKDYKNTKLTRETPIDSFCSTDGCSESFSKKFRYIYDDKTFYCEQCTEKNRLEKIKQTRLSNLDVKKTIFHTNPELKVEWVGDIEDMKKYTKGSNNKLVWKCKSGNECHTWEAAVSGRTRTRTGIDTDKKSASGCPYCSCPPRSLCDCEKCGKSLYYTNPELRYEWVGDVEEMKKYTCASNKKLVWKCKTNNECHIWETTVSHRTDKNSATGCPYCTNTKVCTCEKCGQSLYYTHPELRELWDDPIEEMKKYTKGSELTMNNWKCIKNRNHKWKALISSITQGHGCPYCNGGTSKVMNEDSLYYTNPELRDEWVGDIEEMKKYAKYSGASKSWKCLKFKCHIYESAIKDRTVIKKTGCVQGCPYCCSPSKKICDCGDCDSRSVYYTHPHLIEECKNPEILKKHTFGSKEEITCICKDCKQEWTTKINIRTRGCGCPSCLNKTEMKILKYLEGLGYNNIIQGHNKITFDWCMNEKTNCKFMYDILIKDHHIILEIDGLQHFFYVKYYKNDVEENINRDVYKMIKAKENNYSLIRLYQPDVWEDNNNWKEWLKEKIEFIIKNKECFVFFPDKECYDKHKEIYFK